jgi:hypothetical protein
MQPIKRNMREPNGSGTLKLAVSLKLWPKLLRQNW